MALDSARFSGDPVLEQCLTGAHRMLAPEANLSVMRIQEALQRLGFFSGDLDGFFGNVTGAAVTDYKVSRGVEPSDPVVGPGTTAGLDAELFHDPAITDPDFGEMAPYVATHVVEPFVGFALAPLITAPLNSQRRDTGFFLLSVLNSGLLLGFVVSERAGDLNDPRIPQDTRDRLVADLGPASGRTFHFDDPAGDGHVAVVINQLTVRGQKFLVHQPTGRKVAITLRGTLCHEVSHIRNDALHFDDASDASGDIFFDTSLAATRTQATGFATARVFAQFAHEMMARHVDWIIDREVSGHPLAATFLDPGALCEGAYFYFAESDPAYYFLDNGYMSAIRTQGDPAIYSQIALWLRQVATMAFSGNDSAQQVSAQLFLDAADAADATALDPDAPRPGADGLYPLSDDFL